MPLPVSPLPWVDFPTLGWQIADWMEAFLCHGPGDVEGDDLVIDDEIAYFIAWCYRVHLEGDSEGRRLVQRAILSRPKGRAKSEIAGALVCAEALGPVRFSHWATEGEVSSWGYEYEPGEPVGKPVRSPFIRCLATEEDQSGNTYDNVVVMLTQGEAAEEYGLKMGKEVGITRVFLPGGGEITPSTASSAAKDGGKETFAVADEALALDTPLPTPTGWISMGEVSAGDQLLGSDGEPTAVLKAGDILVDRPCFRVTFEDQTSIVASGGHLWQTRIASSAAKPRIRTTSEMAADGRRFRIPAPPVHDCPPALQEIDPYVLGLWLGDGDSRNATISVGDEDLEETERLIVDSGYTATRCRTRDDKANLLYVSLPGSRKNRFSPVRGLKVRLASAGLIQNKHVPPEYLRGSTEQRTALLQGLMDSDGHATKHGPCSFVGNDQISSDCLALLRSLGQSARRTWVPDTRSREGGYFKINFAPRRGLMPFRLQRKADRVRPHRRGAEWITVIAIEAVGSVPVRCVAVDAPDHLFLAGAAGHVTHNTHLYTTDQLRKMYRTVARNTGKRKEGEPWMLDTTTAWQPGERSIAEQASDKYQGMKVPEAVQKKGVLYDHRQAPEPKRFGQDTSLIKAMREGYGPAAEWMDFQRIVRIIRDAEDQEAEAYRFWLNRPRLAGTQWISAAELDAVTEQREIESGEPIALGIDASEYDDHTALIGCTEDGHLFPVGIWGRPEDWPKEMSWEVPMEEVDQAVRWCFDEFAVARLYADPPIISHSLLPQWARDYGEKKVFEFWTASDGKMAIATGACRTAIRQKNVTLGTEELRTDNAPRNGRPLFIWHLENARTRKVKVRLEDRAEAAYIVTKDRPGSPKKIDSAPAAVLALKARNDALEKDEFKKKRRARLITF